MHVPIRMRSAASRIACALALTVPAAALVPSAALAQNYDRQYDRERWAPRIDSFEVRQVPTLAPGTDLYFVLNGSPHAAAEVRIEGSGGPVALREVDRGRYEGSYTIRRRDRLAPSSRVTANLRVGNRTVSTLLSESIVLPPPRAEYDRGPRIDRFEIQPPRSLAPGEDLRFAVYGAPRGRAEVRIEGVEDKLDLDEVSPGVYRGSYTIRSRDRLRPESTVTVNLTEPGGRNAAMTLSRPLLGAPPPPPPPMREAERRPPPPPAGRCANCATVLTTNIVETKGEGGLLGSIAGGVAGGLLGSQVGEGHGKTAAEVAGVAGGALAGHEIQQRMGRSKHYEVVVSLSVGGSQTFAFETDPGFHQGDRVRIVDGTLVRDE